MDNVYKTEKTFDVVAAGELLIDFTPHGISEQGNVLFERNPGGAPANVLVSLARLGKKTTFIGKVGRDEFGRFLEQTLATNGVETSGLIFSDSVNTTLAFVHLKQDGERSFSFYRNPGADQTLQQEEINFRLIDNSRIFHFGSVSLTDEPSRSATMGALRYAKEQGLLISYDPNLRELLWGSLEEAKRVISEALPYADLLKVSEEELSFLTAETNLSAGTKLLLDRYNIPLIFVTLGKEGCYYRYGDLTGMVAGYQVKTIDTTGAGDSFVGAMLYNILQNGGGVSALDISQLQEFARFANAAGALATTKKGAIPALPKLAGINALLSGASE